MHVLLAVAHWYPHLLSFPRFLDPVSYWWNSGKGYAFTSSGLQLTIPLAILMWWKKHSCDGKWWCPMFGRHPTADGMHHLCRIHHPDLPSRRLSLEEIHARHRVALKAKSAPVD